MEVAGIRAELWRGQRARESGMSGLMARGYSHGALTVLFLLPEVASLIKKPAEKIAMGCDV